MPRAKHYLSLDVVTAARQRVRHIFDLFDSVVVMFSGGKDSLTCLHLVKEVHDEYGLGPVNVVFRDEEVINPTVVDFVNEYRQEPWVNLAWYCLPAVKYRVVLGRKLRYVEWDPSREWVRPMPEWGISAEKIGLPPDAVLNEHTTDDLAARPFKGKVAFVTGIRAAESLVRFRSVTQKLNENYISAIEGNTKSRVKLCKPIYDWQQMDVLKFLYEEKIGWCSLYDSQEVAHVGLRVSTPLHAGAVRNFDKLRAVEPDFYEAVIRIFPEMTVHERYADEFDQKAMFAPYLKDGFEGIERYIQENINNPGGRAKARWYMEIWRGRYMTDPENYPLRQLLHDVANGYTSRRPTGIYVNSKAAQRGRQAK